MENKHGETGVQDGAGMNLSTEADPRDNQGRVSDSHAPSSNDQSSVFIELMLQVPALTYEEPEAILRFIARMDEVHALGLCEDKVFITRILPLVAGV